MINVIALTQFAFLALAIAILKILIQADPGQTFSPLLQTLDRISLGLFLVPILWIGFAFLCEMVNRPPLTVKVARVVGVSLAVLSLLFLISITFLT